MTDISTFLKFACVQREADGRPRVVPLPPAALSRLLRIVATRPPDDDACKNSNNGPDSLLPSAARLKLLQALTMLLCVERRGGNLWPELARDTGVLAALVADAASGSNEEIQCEALRVLVGLGEEDGAVGLLCGVPGFMPTVMGAFESLAELRRADRARSDCIAILISQVLRTQSDPAVLRPWFDALIEADAAAKCLQMVRGLEHDVDGEIGLLAAMTKHGTTFDTLLQHVDHGLLIVLVAALRKHVAEDLELEFVSPLGAPRLLCRQHLYTVEVLAAVLSACDDDAVGVVTSLVVAARGDILDLIALILDRVCAPEDSPATRSSHFSPPPEVDNPVCTVLKLATKAANAEPRRAIRDSPVLRSAALALERVISHRERGVRGADGVRPTAELVRTLERPTADDECGSEVAAVAVVATAPGLTPALGALLGALGAGGGSVGKKARLLHKRLAREVRWMKTWTAVAVNGGDVGAEADAVGSSLQGLGGLIRCNENIKPQFGRRGGRRSRVMRWLL